jgi:hypothetical protein
LGAENFVLVFGLAEFLLEPSLDGMAGIGEEPESYKQKGEQNGNPARSPQIVIVIGFLRVRHVRRNTHSALLKKWVLLCLRH